MASSSNIHGKKTLSTNNVVTTVSADGDIRGEYRGNDFSSSDNENISSVEEEELGNVESAEEEQASPYVAVTSCISI